jgi:hypothetical protein
MDAAESRQETAEHLRWVQAHEPEVVSQWLEAWWGVHEAKARHQEAIERYREAHQAYRQAIARAIAQEG